MGAGRQGGLRGFCSTLQNTDVSVEAGDPEKSRDFSGSSSFEGFSYHSLCKLAKRPVMQ